MSLIKSFSDYKKAYQTSLSENDFFWDQEAREFQWHRSWNKVQSGNFHDLEIKWFEGATLNITENCLDRHLEKHKNKTAIIWEANDPKEASIKLSYEELHQKVCEAANGFKSLGIKKGDVICFYMSMTPELLIGVLACARIGAIHSVVFGGFSAMSLAGRIQDCAAKLLVTNDYALRGNKKLAFKETCDEAVKSCPTIEKVLVHKRTGDKIQWNTGIDFWWHEVMSGQSSKHQAEIVESEHPLFILYTSGSTGKPKGLMHTTAGYMVGTAYTFKNVFQLKDDSIYWCTADIGWITGHSYIAYGPLLNAATVVMFEGIPTYPDAGRFWEVCDKHQVTHFYTAPTAIRALEAQGLEHVKKHALNSLKVLGSVGEPINEEAWQWYHDHIGKGTCPIVDTWWQTETGAIMISPLAGITPSIPSYATLPLPGVEPILVDGEGKTVVSNPAEGNLCLKRPWPSMARSIFGDHERYRQTYFSSYKGLYFTGDGAKRDSEGNYRITGRVDDVINVSGHRIGTAEVEDALNQHPIVVESAVVGFPHDIKGQGIYAYVILTEKMDEKILFKELHESVTKIIGPIAKPDIIQVVSGLPKTRSGKIMRRILRKVAAGELSGLGDVSTLLNPEIVDELIQGKKL
jgi:acetyl-CoA synthetase